MLPENGEKAILIQVPTESIYDEYHKIHWDNTKLEPFLGKHIGRSHMPRNPYNKKRIIKDRLIIKYNDNFFNDGSKTNKVIQKLTNGKCPHDWRGPIVVMNVEGTDFEPFPKYLDVTFKDFPHIIDFFTNMYGDFVEELEEDDQ